MSKAGNLTSIKTRKIVKEICFIVFSVGIRAWSGKSFFRKNKGSQNCRVLVIWTSRAVSSSPLNKMQEIEKKQKSSIEKAFRDKNRLAMLTKKDMADKFISK